MKDKEIIEEMGKIMPEKIKDPLDNSRYIIFGKSLRREIARIYYNAGYRKLPENSVVLSREEWKQIKNSLYYSKEELEKKLQRERKKTVKEILQKVKEKALSHCRTINCYELKFIEETIDELLEEYVK